MVKNFVIIGILSILLLGLTSATTSGVIEISNLNAPTSVAENAGSFTFSFNITYTGTSSNVTISFADSTSSIGSVSIPNATEMNQNDIQTITGTVSSFADLGGQNLTVYINATRGSSRDDETNFTVAITDVNTPSTTDTLCELKGYDEDGDIEITDFDVNNKGDGSEDEWQYLDQIEITVDVENTGNKDIQDVEARIVIYDNKIEDGGKDVTNDFDLEDKVLTDIGKLKDGEEDSVVFLINELPADIDAETYYIYIMVYEDRNEDEQCVSEIDSGDFYFSFTVESVDYEDSIVVKGSEFEEVVNTYCGQQNLEILVPVYNLGDDKEKRVLVNLYDSDLGIDEYVIIKDLDNGDKEVASFFLDIPSNLENEKYNLDVIVSFDWDDKEDADDPSSYDEENSDTSIRLSILQCKAITPSITASLESPTEVGQDLIVKAMITNNGDANDFVTAPTGFDSWADLVSVEPGRTTIASGTSKEIIITLAPKVSGQHAFTISTVVDGETYNQPVSVNIKEEPGIFSDLKLSGTALYLLIAIVVLIILIFIVLVVKVAKKPARASEF